MGQVRLREPGRGEVKKEQVEKTGVKRGQVKKIDLGLWQERGIWVLRLVEGQDLWQK